MQIRTIESMLAIKANSIAATPRVSFASFTDVAMTGFVRCEAMLFDQSCCGTKGLDTRTIAIE